MYVLSEAEQRLVYAKKVEIISRLLEWGIENEQQGLTANLSDSWTPEQRQDFMLDWNNDEALQQMKATEDFTQHWSPEERKSFLLDWNDDEGCNVGLSISVTGMIFFSIKSFIKSRVAKFPSCVIILSESQSSHVCIE